VPSDVRMVGLALDAHPSADAASLSGTGSCGSASVSGLWTAYTAAGASQ
jgi:hypothetical protein